MKKKLTFVWPFIAFAIGCFCVWEVFNAFSLFDSMYQSLVPRKCTPPPEGFSEADLIGTWVGSRLDDFDTLVIRGDGTYKQIIHIEHIDIPDVDYESDWQLWRLEFAENGIPYLHLEGMRLCAINPDLGCDQSGGGGYDFCQNKSLLMADEGILLVLGVPKDSTQPPPRGINLWFPLGSENTWTYSLQEP